MILCFIEPGSSASAHRAGKAGGQPAEESIPAPASGTDRVCEMGGKKREKQMKDALFSIIHPCFVISHARSRKGDLVLTLPVDLFTRVFTKQIAAELFAGLSLDDYVRRHVVNKRRRKVPNKEKDRTKGQEGTPDEKNMKKKTILNAHLAA